MVMNVWNWVTATASEVWERATEVADAPSLKWVLLLAGVAFALITFRGPWGFFRHGITIVHEGGHALIAFLMGRRLQGVRLHRDTSGLTVSRGKPTGLGMILTAFAGYPAPAALGLFGAWLISTGHAVGLLWVMLLGTVCVGLLVRNWFGVWTVLVSVATLFSLVWFTPVSFQVLVANGVVFFLLLGAVRPVFEMQGERRGLLRRGRKSKSDADLLGQLTWFSAGFWVGFMVLFVLGCAALGGWWIATDFR